MEKLKAYELVEIGSERFVKNHCAKKLILVAVGLGIAILASTLLENHIVEWLRTLITILILVIFGIPYVKLIVVDSHKAGKKFFEEFKTKYPDMVQEESK